MKTNIKMRVTPEQSMKVQNIVVANLNTQNKVATTDIHFPYIVISTMGTFGTRDMEFYKIQNYKEIDADLFIRTNGTCEEKISEKIMKENTENLETFIKKNNCENISDLKRIIVLTANKHDILEIKLKKKNEILKKARIKRKNQREELHKLNLKLQKCISLEEYKYIKKDNEYNLQLKQDRIKDLQDCNERLMEQNKCIKDSLDNLMDIRNNQNNEIEQLKAENKSLKESSKISCNMLHSQKDKIDRLELNYVSEQSIYKKEIEKLKAVIEYLESKVK